MRETKIEKVSLNTYEAEDKEFYQSLKGILRVVSERKKGHIRQASGKVLKETDVSGD